MVRLLRSDARQETRAELLELAREMDITGYSRLKKHELTMRLLQAQAESQGLLFGGGILDVVSDGIGFLRSGDLLPSPDDIVPEDQAPVVRSRSYRVPGRSVAVLIRA